MFINTQILKRLMKEAYKGKGLRVARTEERYYISGGHWELDVLTDFAPKEVLAQIMELTGDIPAMYESYLADESGNQSEFELPTVVKEDGFVPGIEVTKFILLGARNEVPQRILQSDAGKTYIVNNVFIDIISRKNIEEARGEVADVQLTFRPEQGILWSNNVARLHAYWRVDDYHERVLKDLQDIDLREDPPEKETQVSGDEEEKNAG